MTKTALITGIAGQDGSYLAELLLREGFEVHGIVRRNSVPEHQESRIHHLQDQINTHYGDVLDSGSLDRTVSSIRPDLLFNLAAQSHVRISFEIPEFTTLTNSIGALNVFESVRQNSPKTRVYQASSSEMFGTQVDSDGFQRETTQMLPASPYGCSKLFAYHAARTYRDSYNLFIANGILFNHESPRRGSNFVTTKVVKEAVKIKLGLSDKLTLGNLDSYRDWGHSADYVKAMLQILRQDSPLDLVIATGETHSVRELCEQVFSLLDLNYLDFVTTDEKYLRPKEVPLLRGDASAARKTLDWAPEYTFKTLIEEMVEHWMKITSSGHSKI
jgi:GDPmannose 4,6-dehydratase